MGWFVLGYVFGSSSVVLAIWMGSVLAARSSDAVYERIIEGPGAPATGRDDARIDAPEREPVASGSSRRSNGRSWCRIS